MNRGHTCNTTVTFGLLCLAGVFAGDRRSLWSAWPWLESGPPQVPVGALWDECISSGQLRSRDRRRAQRQPAAEAAAAAATAARRTAVSSAAAAGGPPLRPPPRCQQHHHRRGRDGPLRAAAAATAAAPRGGRRALANPRQQTSGEEGSCKLAWALAHTMHLMLGED